MRCCSALAIPRSCVVPALLLVAVGSTLAGGYPEPAEADFTIHGFRFAGGETLPEIRIHYRTLGTPRRDSAGTVRNAVLLLHGTYVLIPTSAETRGHGTHSYPVVWQEHLKSLLEELPRAD